MKRFIFAMRVRRVSGQSGANGFLSSAFGPRPASEDPGLKPLSNEKQMELNLLLTLDLREQAALQAALVTHGAPDALVTLALTGACRIGSLEEARQLRKWLAEARTAGEADFASFHAIERAMIDFGL